MGRAGWMASLILAARFLTSVPIPGAEATGPGALGRAAWWFPAIGLVLGGGLMLADRLLMALVPLLLSAVLTLAIWKVSTGGLHLDGLADCLDGLRRDSRIGVRDPRSRARPDDRGRRPREHSRVRAGSGTPDGPGPGAAHAPPDRPRAACRHARPRSRRRVSRGASRSGQTDLARRPAPPHLGEKGAAGLGGAAGALIAGTVGVVVLSAHSGGLTGDTLGASVEIAELAVLVMSAVGAPAT